MAVTVRNSGPSPAHRRRGLAAEAASCRSCRGAAACSGSLPPRGYLCRGHRTRASDCKLMSRVEPEALTLLVERRLGPRAVGAVRPMPRHDELDPRLGRRPVPVALQLRGVEAVLSRAAAAAVGARFAVRLVGVAIQPGNHSDALVLPKQREDVELVCWQQRSASDNSAAAGRCCDSQNFCATSGSRGAWEMSEPGAQVGTPGGTYEAPSGMEPPTPETLLCGQSATAEHTGQRKGLRGRRRGLRVGGEGVATDVDRNDVEAAWHPAERVDKRAVLCRRFL